MDFIWHDQNASRMSVHRNGDVVWLSFPEMDKEDWCLNVFSTRMGGISTGHLASMNLSFGREGPGNEETVRENFRRLGAAAGFAAEDVILSDQTHTTNVRRVGRKDRGSGFLRPLEWTDVDGFITDEPGCVLSTFYADCVPLYFADPRHRAIGLSHSGWKGTAHKMGAHTVRAMEKAFGTRPEDLLCGIGPSICQDSYEVGEDVARFFRKEFLIEKGNGKFLLDLWAANKAVLTEAGVREENIEMSNLCTSCNADLLFSHRASKGRRGNLGAFLMIREMPSQYMSG